MTKRPAKLDGRGYIWCMGCQEYVSPFRFGKYDPARPPARCKKCRSKASHAKRIKSEFGLTPEAYAVLLDHQGGLCAICRRPSRVRRLAVDHDHQTGMVRGLLCRACNYELLGRIVRDDVEVLRRAIQYLETPPVVGLILGDSWPPR